MNDDLLYLASAYLADDVTDDERARVEADPELLAMVDELRVVSRSVAEVEPPTDEVRERAVAAALAAWDAMPSATADTTDVATEVTATVHAASATSPILLRRRPRTARVLAVAAACVALAALGAVVVSGQRTSNDFDAASTDVADQAAEDSMELLEAPAAAPDVAPDALDDAAAPDDLFESAPADTVLAAESIDDDGESADTPDAPREPDTGAVLTTDAPPGGTSTPTPVVANDHELVELVRRLLDEKATDGDDADVADDRTTDEAAVTCQGLVANELGDAVYAGRLVVVGVDAATERARAVDPSDCSLVADVALENAG